MNAIICNRSPWVRTPFPLPVSPGDERVGAMLLVVGEAAGEVEVKELVVVFTGSEDEADHLPWIPVWPVGAEPCRAERDLGPLLTLDEEGNLAAARPDVHDLDAVRRQQLDLTLLDPVDRERGMAPEREQCPVRGEPIPRFSEVRLHVEMAEGSLGVVADLLDPLDGGRIVDRALLV